VTKQKAEETRAHHSRFLKLGPFSVLGHSFPLFSVVCVPLWLIGVWGSAVICANAAGQVQAQNTEGAQQFAEFGELKLQNGAVIQDFRLGYRTFGKLNAEKSNAVLWPTWLGGKTQDLLKFVGSGPANVVDSTKYFVILVDAIGDGVSTSPSNSKTQPLGKFPEFTIRDMVESEHRLATETFHFTHLHAVMGISMGGMQTFEWVVAYPDFMDEGIPMMGSPQSTAYDKVLWTSQIQALELDPAWNGGNPSGPLTRGMLVSEEIDSMNLTSPAYRVARTAPQDFDEFMAELKKNSMATGGRVWDMIRQREAINALDIPGEFGVTLPNAARRVHAKLLVLVSPEDHMVNPATALAFSAAIQAPVVELDSPCGHIALDCISMGPTVARFLADPASAHSEVVRDTGSHLAP
jgi:homoserine O-acetyltransferase